MYYRVPICCIQDPDAYNIDPVNDAMKAKKVPNEKQITVSVLATRQEAVLLDVDALRNSEGLLAN